ncbi:MAG: hypothetical protein JXQ90_16930 [Cyclobacteriaceae bacterium]
MRSLFKRHPLFFILICLCISGCGDDEPGIDCAKFTISLADEAKEIATAATAFLADRSTENCMAYLTAIDNYIEASEPFVEECSDDEGFSVAQEAIDGYKAQRDQLDCSF